MNCKQRWPDPQSWEDEYGQIESEIARCKRIVNRGFLAMGIGLGIIFCSLLLAVYLITHK